MRAADAPRQVAAAVALHLHEAGLRHVVAPIRSSTNQLSVQHERVALTVYPLIDGRTGVEAGLSSEHWRALGAFARRLHESRLPPDLAALPAQETYRPAEVDLVRRLDDAVAGGGFAGEPARDVAALWRERRGVILALADETERLGRELQQRASPHVLCHADLHTWNVIVDDAGELWIVDWDEVVYAPKERDLMFVVGGIGAGLVAESDTICFFEGYGETTVDPLALSYYRHAWATQDIGSYAEVVLLGPTTGADDERSEAARILIGLFAPGEIVELARTSVP